VHWLLAAGLALASPQGGDEALEEGTYEVRDASGATIAQVTIRDDQPAKLNLPTGDYRLVDGQGAEVSEIHVEAGEPWVLGGSDEPERAPNDPLDAVLPSPRLTPTPKTEAAQRSAGAPKPWKAWGSPLLGALVPGLGHAINREGGRALAFFATTAGLALGLTAVILTDDPTEGTGQGDTGRSGGLEIGRLIGLSTLSTGLAMVWAGQVMDAHAVGRGRPAQPKRDYAVSMTFNRFSTIGMRAGQPSYALYDDWSLSVLGQVVPRVEVGLADMSIKLGDRRGAYVVQAGPRAMWRFFDRHRLWLSLGGGFVFQGASSPPTGLGLEESPGDRRSERGFGAVPYAQLQAELFLLDRWTLGLMPRVSVPLTDRFYQRGRKIPRYSTTFELGASVGVKF
jgi:hypothetical protein